MFKRALPLIFAAATGLYSASAQNTSNVIADKIVAVVGNSAILYSDVVEYSQHVEDQYRENKVALERDPMAESLENLMLQKLLYHKAMADSLQVNLGAIQDMVSRNVNMMVEQRGSIGALEAEMGKPIFDIREDYNKRYTEMSYAQQMQEDVQRKVKITTGEVTRFYRNFDKDSLNFVPAQYEYAQIVKYPASTASAKQRTRESLLALRERIINGDKFEVLARIYSKDLASAVRGGEMDPMPKESLTKPFADAMTKLRPGQVSGIVETDFGYHLIQMIEKKGNLYHVRHILLRPEFSPDELSQTALRLDSVVNLVRSDSISFERAALEYSDDKSSRLNGGMVSNLDILERMSQNDAAQMSTKIYKENLPKSDYDVISKLSLGEISDAFAAQDIRGNVILKSLKLVNITPSHLPTIESDFAEIEKAALQHKQQQEFVKWLNKQIEITYVRIAPEYRNSDIFVNKTWLK